MLVLVCASLISACSFTKPRNPVPLDQLERAKIPGIRDARAWGDVPPANIDAMLAELYDQWRASGVGREFTLLALSGGADEGAFGAGILNGWSENGDRPEFTVVTGVSTGALSAPFAFLGSDYDAALRRVYGGLPPEDVFVTRSLVSILPEASLADPTPQADVIADYVDEGFLAKIAAEHRRGRRLLVQSTHIDAQRPVLWNLGAIADSGEPNAVEVFRKALLASASIPVAFPPTVMEVEVDGVRYDELHADGGVVSEDTVYIGWQTAIHDRADPADIETLTFYVVRNGRVAPEAKTVDYNLLDLAERSVGTLIKAQGVSNLITAYEAAQIRGADFYVTWIGADFEQPYVGPFDPDYMRALYQHGYDRMRDSSLWQTEPPVLDRAPASP